MVKYQHILIKAEVKFTKGRMKFLCIYAKLKMYETGKTFLY